LRRLALLLATLLALAGGALVCGTALGSGADDLMSIESQFICTSCHEPLELVSSPEALSEKAYLESLVSQDLTMGQIKSAMVAQYGTAVLARPPASGFNLTVYILPPAILVGGLLLLAYTLPKWRERSRQAAATPLEGAQPLTPGEAERLNDELEKFV
jgi:cytochrome c-type biogenesis protein CcmH